MREGRAGWAVDRCPADRWTWGVSARPAPASVVDHLGGGTTRPSRRGARAAGILRPVADGDRPAGGVVVGHAERLPERLDPVRRDAEEAGAEPLVDRGLQYQQRGHA